MEQGDEVIATGAIVENEIYGVFVEPTLQDHGHGKVIMHELESRAKAKGYIEVMLSVSLPSKTFYERLGYRAYEESHIDVGEGQRLDFWRAKKSLHK